MNNIGMLYGFELKKILKNRLTIVMLVITVFFILVEAVSPGMANVTGEDPGSLDGRVIDDALLGELQAELVANGGAWNGDAGKYNGIAKWKRDVLESNEKVAEEYTAQQLYQAREENILSMMEENSLSDGEIAWWKNQMEGETPFTYYDYNGALILSQGLVGVLLCIMLLSALCLSTVFTVEHRQRTDQLVLSCKNGRGRTYFVKIAAGLSVVVACCVLATGLLALLTAILYGLNGFNAVVQLEIPASPYAFTMGQFIAVQGVVMITAGILFAAFAMAVSELLKNSLAVMGIMVGLFIFGQLEIIPPKYLLLLKLRAMLPSNQVSVWSLMEYHLFNFGSHYCTGYLVSPITYLALSAALIAVGGWVYNRFQVTGR